MATTQPAVAERNIAATREIYEAVRGGDLQAVLGRLDPEVRVEFVGTDEIPFAGDWRGIDGAVEFFTKVGETVAVESVEPWRFIADGDDLAVWGRIVLVPHAGGRIESDFAHIIALRDGRWLHFRDFQNSALTAKVLNGR